jgi:hypothetical protein
MCINAKFISSVYNLNRSEVNLVERNVDYTELEYDLPVNGSEGI